jgi:hypothetical protein
MADINAKDGAGAADYICSRAVPRATPSARALSAPKGWLCYGHPFIA